MTARTTPRKHVLKTYCKDFTITEDHVAAAYEQWEKALAGKKNRHRIDEEHGDPETLIREITLEIRDRRLTLRPIHYYWHHEPSNGKLRRIGVQSVKQQVVDYVAVLALEQFLDARIGYYQVASMPGKGQLFAAKAIRRWSQEGGYWVHLDARQCYPTISHDLVQRIIDKHVRAADVRYVVAQLLRTYDQGLMIGSYFSLKMAQLVLSFAYHYVEGLSKRRRGKHVALVTHQAHFMDDMLLMGRDKRDLRTATKNLEAYMKRELGLTLKPWKISRVGEDEPIDLAGYVIRPSRTTIRSSIFLSSRRALRDYERNPTLENAYRACSYWGWVKNADTLRFQHANKVPQTVTAASTQISQAHKASQ